MALAPSQFSPVELPGWQEVRHKPSRINPITKVRGKKYIKCNNWRTIIQQPTLQGNIKKIVLVVSKPKIWWIYEPSTAQQVGSPDFTSDQHQTFMGNYTLPWMCPGLKISITRDFFLGSAEEYDKERFAHVHIFERSQCVQTWLYFST